MDSWHPEQYSLTLRIAVTAQMYEMCLCQLRDMYMSYVALEVAAE